MASRTNSAGLHWDPSLKKVFKGSERWWSHFMVNGQARAQEEQRLRKALAEPGVFVGSSIAMRAIGNSYAAETCILSGQGDVHALPLPLHRAVEFRNLEFRSMAGRSLPADSNPVLPFESSMQAIGPTMLSQWNLGKISAEQLIAIAHKDQAINVPQIRKDGWGKGTSDAFVIALLSQAYGIATHYASVAPLVTPYQRLLDMWRTKGEGQFQSAMQEAAQFHIAHSYYGGAGKTNYEFEVGFDLVYPGELLAVQALRRRDGLPEFETEVLLVDTPWRIIRDLPHVSRDPLVVDLETRLQQDFPKFR
jgi:hypothetical protein